MTRKATTVKTAGRPALRVGFQSIENAKFGDDVEEIQDADDAGQDGDDDNMFKLEMLSMLKDFQKRKATKTISQSSAFQNKKNAILNDARKNTDTIVQDGIAYIEQCKVRLAELRAQEAPWEEHFNDLSQFSKFSDDSAKHLFDMFAQLLGDASHQRAEQIEHTCTMVESHSEERLKSRRKLIKTAKARLDERLENQKVASDASALIEHYKALLLTK